MDNHQTSFSFTLRMISYFYTPPHFSGGVLLYTFRCPFVRPSAPFPVDNLSICSWNFFKFCIHIVVGDEWFGIVDGLKSSIFKRVTALVYTEKTVSGVLFLYYLWYLNETSQLCLSLKVTYCDKEPSLRLFQFRSYLPLIDPKNVFFSTCSFIFIWNF